MASILISQRFYPEKGGSISWWQELYQHWPEPFTIITSKYSEKTYPELKLNNCTQIIREDILMDDWGIKNPASFLKYIRIIRLLFRQITAAQSEIHCTHIIPEGLAAICCKIIKPQTKVIAYVHGEELLAYSASRELQLLFKLVAGSIDLYICNSQNTASLLQRLHPKINLSKIKVVLPCIDYQGYQITSSRSELRRKYKLKEQGCYLVSLGRLIKRKNQGAVIAALKQLIPKYPNLNYLCLGSGPEKSNLENLSKTLNLTEHVTFLEPFAESEKIELLNAADIFILPTIPTATDIEGFGIALVEAQACGLPVICGNSGGETEAVQADISALVIDATKPSEIIAAIAKIAENPDLYSELANASKRNAQKFDSLASSKTVFNLIKGLRLC